MSARSNGYGKTASLAGLAALIALAILTPFLYSRLELAPLRYPVTGIDVSHHQGEIDWRRVAESGVAFAYIKATEGGESRDERFVENWEGAKVSGILRGAYHFFTLCRSGAEQAQNFIGVVPREPGALPPVVDAEHMGPCRHGKIIDDPMAELEAFIARVERHIGQRLVVYTTAEFEAAMLAGKLTQERFWARSLVLEPRFRQEQWLFWQYHNRGARPGITGPVDLNVFRGSRAELERLRAAAPKN